MTGPRQKPPTEPPPSAGVLARYARAYRKRTRRQRRPCSSMDLVHDHFPPLLEQSRESDGYRFTVKGGVALELRLKDRARATKDIDLVLHHAEVDLARALERAVDTSARGHLGFNFRRKGEPLVLENGTISVEFAVTYEGGAWTSIIVDVARAEPGEGEIEAATASRSASGGNGHHRADQNWPVSRCACTSRRNFTEMTLPPRRETERAIQGLGRRLVDGAARYRLRGTSAGV